MKRILFTYFLILFVIAAKAQIIDTTKQIFTAVEMEPSFPGGIDRFYRYLQANIRYPDSAVKNRSEGKVFVGFVVEKDGSLTDAKVLRGVRPDIDAEAIRVVNKSPKWIPGIQNGRPVRVQYNIALIFKLPAQQSLSELRLRDSLLNLPADQKIFSAVEKEPQFPGGIEKFYQYLVKNERYPDRARENNIRGKVFLSFVVEKDGSLTEIKVNKPLSPETDAEAIRLLNNSPKWKPGMQNGRPVRVAYTMPITFPPLSDD